MKLKRCYKKCLFSLVLLFFLSLCVPQTASAASKPGTVKSLKCGITTGNSINISWKSVKGVSGYQVFRSASYDGPFEKVKDIAAGTHAFCNLKLQGGREYYYRVRAYSGRGSRTVTGSFSKVLSARTKCASRTAAVRSNSNVRKHAGINHPIAATLSAGTKVTIICTTNDKSGTSWSRITYLAGGKKKSGYIRSDLLTAGQSKPKTQTGIVIAGTGLRLRRSASISSGIIITLPRGAKVTILGQSTGTDKQKQYHVSVKRGRKTYKGYAAARYIRIS